jgi:hypothetical protein
MTLKAKTEPDALKRIAWLEDTILPDDYDVIHESETVGRVYRIKADRELWRWTITHGPNGEVANTLERQRPHSAAPETRTDSNADQLAW